MTVEKLRRVLWRLCRKEQARYNYRELRKAISLECGVHDKTYKSNKKALVLLGWIRGKTKTTFEVTESGREEL
jgi:hypothetical protein